MTRNVARRKNNTNQVAAGQTNNLSNNLAALNIKSTVLSLEDVQKQLEADFGAQLDSALIAALVSEAYDPLKPFLGPLRENLQSLALTVGGSNDSDVVPASDVLPNTTSRTALFSTQTPSRGSRSHSASLSSSIDTPSQSLSSIRSPAQSEVSSISEASFTSPIGFLRSLFPNVTPKLIENTLLQAGWIKSSPEADAELNMNSVIETLLSEEYVREIIERGYVPGEEGDPSLEGVDELEGGEERGEVGRVGKDWEVVQKNNRAAASGNIDTNGIGSKKGKRHKDGPGSSKPTTISLFDVRQRHHATTPSSSGGTGWNLATRDQQWVYIQSIATQLHHLVPQTSFPSHLALFHNPSYPTPGAAVRAHLSQLRQRSPRVPSEENVSILVGLLASSEAGNPQSTDLQWATRALQDDAEMCLCATRGDVSTAYDLYTLLKDVEKDGGSTLYHSPAPSSALVASSTPGSGSGAQSQPATPTKAKFPASSPMPLPPTSAPSSPRKPPPKSLNPQAWQTVSRGSPASSSSSLALIKPSSSAAHIPALQPDNLLRAERAKRKGPPSFKPPPSLNGNITANTSGLGKEYGGAEAERCRARAEGLRERRNAALRQASTAWKSGKHGKHGGEIALFYAEEARKLESERKQWDLQGAREQVSRSMGMISERDVYAIDLHGLTVQESIVVSKEQVNKWWNSAGSGTPSGTFTIITGAGTHSSGRLGVLGPAVQKALEADGWRVRKEYAKLVVTSAQGGRR